MKSRKITPNSRGHRQALFSGVSCRSPKNNENHFDAQIESMISDFSSQYSSNRPVTSFRNGYRGAVNNEEASFSTLSEHSKCITTDRNMKESKRLFTKCIQ